jgi:hypothetical protein
MDSSAVIVSTGSSGSSSSSPPSSDPPPCWPDAPFAPSSGTVAGCVGLRTLSWSWFSASVSFDLSATKRSLCEISWK